MGFLDNDIKYLKGVGEERGKILKKEFEISTFRDLLYYFPFRHVDRSRFYRIAEFSGEMPMLQVKGRFLSFRTEGEGAKKRLAAVFSDGERMMEVLWFSKIKTFETAYQTGKEYVLFGKPNLFRSVYSMAHPEVSAYNPDNPPSGFQGVYSVPDKMHKRGYSSRMIAGLMKNIISHPGFSTIEEIIPQEIISRYNLLPLGEALRELHFPTSAERLSKARERMKFEELYFLELHIVRYSRERSTRLAGRVFRRVGDYFNKFYFDVLPFELTGAQKRVLREIRGDMKTGRQMNRLLQGDVGSGKTMVAFMTLLLGLDNDTQGALMAPTEILATQHYNSLKPWADALGIEIRLLTGSTRTSARREIHESLENGKVQIIIGTHALIEEKVKFHCLGVVVIDEQHRFGVAQRGKMWTKDAIAPHVLVMTATPIPRTLAMTVYGDLEVSVIDELPPGRKPIATYLRYDSNRMEVDRLIWHELKAGRQIYIVYPLVKENEKLALKSLEAGYKRTCDTFHDIPVCYVHGKMKPDEKDHQMELFVSGKARILVSTTVIEVGVNVPNASVMIIENAERFGLSQLHQLRGRVGRGAEKSYCVLMGNVKSSGDTKKRLTIMTETTDGFIISEADMKLRGPGDMEGTQQSGLAFNLKLANLARDGQVLTLARQVAIATVDSNGGLLRYGSGEMLDSENRDKLRFPLSLETLDRLKAELDRRFSKKMDWSLIS